MGWSFALQQDVILKPIHQLIGPLAVLFGFVFAARLTGNACAIPVRRSGVYAR
jgi:hypothetical protein